MVQFFYSLEFEKLCIMGDEMKQQFFQKKLDDMLNDNINVWPTIICERERPEILEYIRQYCLYSNRLVPYLVEYHPKIVSEGLDIPRGNIDFGNLYIEVFVN